MFLDGKSLKDLQPVSKNSAVSNLIELTDEEKLEIVELLKQGKSFAQVKKEFKRVVDGSYLSASLTQIHDINKIWKNSLAVAQDESGLLFLSEDGMSVLSKCAKCGKYPCECVVEEPEIEF